MEQAVNLNDEQMSYSSENPAEKYLDMLLSKVRHTKCSMCQEKINNLIDFEWYLIYRPLEKETCIPKNQYHIAKGRYNVENISSKKTEYQSLLVFIKRPNDYIFPQPLIF